MQLEQHPTVQAYRQMAGRDSVETPGQPLQADDVKKMCLDSGADDVGLVDINHPGLAECRGDILAAFPRTRTLVSFVCRMNRENIRCPNRAVSDLEFVESFHRVNRVARGISERLIDRQVKTLTPSCVFPMDIGCRWPGKIWDVPFKTVAEAAGLGKMGLHRILIHPRFGSFVALGAVLIDRPVDKVDQPLDYTPCLDCKLCAAVCPVGAVSADGHFYFSGCMTHNYRDRLGGFQNWVENMVSSRSVKEYRGKVSDPETVSMWQSLSYGICNKSSYCMAVCPAGLDNVGLFLENKKQYLQDVVKPFQDKTEMVFVVKGSDAEDHVKKRFPHKQVRLVGNGLRADSAREFLMAAPLVFQRDKSEGLDATFHFTFNSNKNTTTGTIDIRDRTITVSDGHQGTPDLHLIADEDTWVGFLAKEKNLVWALATRKIKIKGSPRLMSAFARCFPS